MKKQYIYIPIIIICFFFIGLGAGLFDDYLDRTYKKDLQIVEQPIENTESSESDASLAKKDRMLAKKDIYNVYKKNYLEYRYDWGPVFKDIDSSSIGTDKGIYDIEQFTYFIYDKYIKGYFNETDNFNIHLFFIDTTDNINKAEGSMILGKSLGNCYTYKNDGEIIIIYNDWSYKYSNLSDLYSEFIESLNGDTFKNNDVSINYNGKIININKDALSNLMHEMIHTAERHDKDYDNSNNHKFYKSLNAEKGIKDKIGVDIRFTENQEFDE